MKLIFQFVVILLFIVDFGVAFKYRRRYYILTPPVIPYKIGLDPIEEIRFTQKLDHFNTSVTATWQQVDFSRQLVRI
jgi:hypothetical protein